MAVGRYQRKGGNTNNKKKAVDLSVAGSSGYGYYCPEGIPAEAALLATLGAFAVAFGVLYMEVTMATARRKRNTSSKSLYHQHIFDTIWNGRSFFTKIESTNHTTGTVQHSKGYS